MATASEIDLTQFAANCKSRYAIDRVFVQDGHRCATNGFVAVRVPCDESESDTDTGERFPPVADVVVPKQTTTDADWKPWPVDAELVMGKVKCGECEGGYIGRVSCGACGGFGDIPCPCCDSDMKCKTCGGKGTVKSGAKCETCKGSAEVDGPVAYPVGPAHVSAANFNKIAALPNAVYYWPKPSAPCYFRFDGDGEGAVMPRKVK